MTFMMRPAVMAIYLASGLVWNAGLCADELTAGNPGSLTNYAVIADRNVFGLVPPAPVNPSVPPPDADLPRITANGIMSIFGHLEVLFKTGRPGSKDVCYDLSEGEKQDDIEVMHIDEKAGQVAFKNHGITQEIALAVESSGGINNIGNRHNNNVGFGQLPR
jgi:hypothetical protein